MRFTLPLVILALIAPSCRKAPAAPAPPSRADVEAEARRTLHQLAYSAPFRGVLPDLRTAPAGGPSHLGTLSGDWTSKDGPVHFRIQTFYQDGEWFFDPDGSTGTVLGMSRPESVTLGTSWLPVIAAEIGLHP